MQSETGFPSSHQLKSYVVYKSRLKLAARAVLSADAGLLVLFTVNIARRTNAGIYTTLRWILQFFLPAVATHWTDGVEIWHGRVDLWHGLIRQQNKSSK